MKALRAFLVSLLVWGLTCVPAFAAVTVVQQATTPANGQVNSGTTTTTLTYSLAAGKAVTILIGSGSTTVTACSDGTNTYAVDSTFLNGATSGRIYVCRIANPAAVTGATLTITTNIAGRQNVAVLQYAGAVASGSPINAFSSSCTGTLNAVSPACTLAISTAGDLAISATETNSTAASFADSGWTQLAGAGVGSTNSELHVSWQAVPNSTTVSSAPTWTTARSYTLGILDIKVLSGASGLHDGMLTGVIK